MRRTCLLVGAALLIACGGGGGGGAPSDGGAPPHDGGTAEGIAFLGISFRLTEGLEVHEPPLDDPAAWPPSLGAPLDTVIVFHFSGPPVGPLDGHSLPVFTTPDALPPEVMAPAVPGYVPAAGDWVAVGHDVEFRPQIPVPPMIATISAPSEQQPGLFPGARYTARVSDHPAVKIHNLVGAGGEVAFDTASHPPAFYPAGAGDWEPPQVVSIEPPGGALHPGVFSDWPPQAVGPSFEPAPRSILLTYAGPLSASADVLHGSDLDGDGVREAQWAFVAGATRLFTALAIPAGTFGNDQVVAAVAGLSDDVPGAGDGSDVVLHSGLADLALPAGHGLGVTPRTLTVDRDAGLLWILGDAPSGGVHLQVVDHVLGDPNVAAASVDATGAAGTMAVPLGDPVGLMATLDGRLLVFDRVTRRIHEVRPSIVRRPSGLDGAPPAAPWLLDVSLGDGVNGFASEPFADPLLDVVDLLQSPSGDPWALSRSGAGSGSALHRLALIDPDVDGVFQPGEGLPTGEVVQLPMGYVAALWEDDTTLLALDDARDVVERVDVTTGKTSVVVTSVANRGWPGPWQPARDLSRGFLEIPARVDVVANGPAGAVVSLDPAAILPFGQRVDLVQRNALSSLQGVSLVNGSAQDPRPPLGVIRLATYSTPEPSSGYAALVDDAFLETFVDDAFEDAEAPTSDLLAHWASQGGLRASIGTLDGQPLGDFLPAPLPGGPNTPLAYRRSPEPPEPGLSLALGNLRLVLLDTDAQLLPMADGSTPGVSEPVTVLGGHFVFRDIVIPEGVRVMARGTRPLRLTATGSVSIHGILDVAGTDGASDDTFDSGFLPVPGGAGGPGGGRGGDGHPTRFDPKGPGTLDQYVTPETGEHGRAPFAGPSGTLEMQPRGGRGGASTVGYDPRPDGTPRVPNLQPNSELHRPPGGGGGSYRQRGRAAQIGSGSYRVQSESTWFPFSHCPMDDKIRSALYGNDENRAQGTQPSSPLQCVYMLGEPQDPERLIPGGAPGDDVFIDATPTNDFIGAGGELPLIQGGQGGGGGGSRVVSLDHTHWSAGPLGQPSPFGPPYFPSLLAGVFVSPTRFDSKGAGGGGGGGAVQIRSFGDLEVGRSGIIDAGGGHGGGGEVVSNSNLAGGGGGGSGGAILLQSATTISLRADPGHRSAGYIDVSGALGAAVDVSGGFGRDARTSHPGNDTILKLFTHDVSRGDGGHGGFGLIQLQAGSDGLVIEPGSFLFARQRAPLKLGPWTGDPQSLQAEHPNIQTDPSLPFALRFIDMLHHRYAYPEGFPGSPGVPPSPPRDRYLVLNGSWPPLVRRDVQAAPVLAGSGVLPHEHPEGSGLHWADTRMLELPSGSGRWLVEEPEPHKVMRTYNGFSAVVDDEGQVVEWVEINNPAQHPEYPLSPGATWKGERIPLSLDLQRPDGTPMPAPDGAPFADAHVLDRLPVVPPAWTAATFGSVSQGTSRWMAFGGATLRRRDPSGLTPPFCLPFHGTQQGSGDDAGSVLLAGKVPGLPAHYVLNAGLPPFDPGLHGNGSPPDAPFNDLAVDAPELLLQDALSQGARVSVHFQGAHPVRPGALVPAPDGLSPWVADPTRLDGFALLRFRVTFDVADEPGAVLGPTTPRPRLDDLRLRMRY